MGSHLHFSFHSVFSPLALQDGAFVVYDWKLPGITQLLCIVGNMCWSLVPILPQADGMME